jgi:hypothetical protein
MTPFEERGGLLLERDTMGLSLEMGLPWTKCQNKSGKETLTILVARDEYYLQPGLVGLISLHRSTKGITTWLA